MTTKLKILVYNIAANYAIYGDYARIDKIRQVLVEGDWDLIALTEVYNKSLRTILLESHDIHQRYPHRAYNLSDYGDLPLLTFDNGLAILSKYPITTVHRYEYQNRLESLINKIFSPKDLLHAQIRLDDKEVDIFLTHLQWGDMEDQRQTRLYQFEELLEQVGHWGDRSRPAIICGDMNIFGYSDSEEYQRFRSLFKEFTDWHAELHPDDTAKTWSPTNVNVFNWYQGERWDYILGSKHFTPLSSSILKFKGRMGPHIMKWKPTSSISAGDRLRIVFKRLIRLPLLPLMVFVNFWLTIYRVWHGFPQNLILLRKDLSDHYALEGEARLGEN